MIKYIWLRLIIIPVLFLSFSIDAQTAELDALNQKIFDANLSDAERKELILKRKELRKKYKSDQRNIKISSKPILKKRLATYQSTQDSLIKQLKLNAKNYKLPYQERVDAIYALALIQSDDSYKFLIDHLTKLVIISPDPKEAGSEYVVFFALSEIENKWALLPFLLQHLNEQEEDTFYHLFTAQILVEIFEQDKSLTKVFIDYKIKKESGLFKENLLRVKAALKDI